MKTLVLGGEGMLGHKMFQTLLQRDPETACTIVGALDEPFYQAINLFEQGQVLERVNAMDLPALVRLLQQHQPSFIVNCIGVIKQRDEARAAIPSITLNSLLPHKLVEVARYWGGRVIHFSTDCVFNGHEGQYREDSPSDAEDLYGKSKFLGEVAEINAITLRTSIIGRELAHFRSLLEWFLSQRGKTIHGFTQVIYSGVTTNYLAGLVGRLIEEHPTLSGLYQVTSPPLSKYELLCMLREAYSLDVEILPETETLSDRSMLGDKFLEATGYDLPSWPDLVAELAADPTPYTRWRERTEKIKRTEK